MNSDEIRSKITALFDQFKDSLNVYADYAHRAGALGIEYHVARFSELQAPMQELTLAKTLDARETPASFDNFLANLKASGKQIKLVIFDRANCAYHIYV
jgi:hypothetical protein